MALSFNERLSAPAALFSFSRSCRLRPCWKRPDDCPHSPPRRILKRCCWRSSSLTTRTTSYNMCSATAGANRPFVLKISSVPQLPTNRRKPRTRRMVNRAKNAWRAHHCRHRPTPVERSIQHQPSNAMPRRNGAESESLTLNDSSDMEFLAMSSLRFAERLGE